jgi:hypothetical protein
MEHIGNVIEDLWTFLLGPVIETTLLFLVAWYLLGDQIRTAILGLQPRALSALRNKSAQETAEAYGITKVLPLAIVFMIVFVLYAVSVSLALLGSMLPGEFTVTPDSLLLHQDNSELARCWDASPSLEEPWHVAESARTRIEMAVDKAPTSIGRGVKHWNEESMLYLRRLDTTKAFMVVSVGLAVFAFRNSRKRWLLVRRLSVVLAVCGLCAASFLMLALNATWQKGYANLAVLRIVLSETPLSDQSDPDLASRHRKAIDEYKDRTEQRWWNYSIMAEDYREWPRVLRAWEGGK